MSSTPTSYPLSESQISDFRHKGHILLPGVATPEEIARFQPAIRDASYRYNTEQRALEDRDTYGKAFLQIMNLWQVDEEVKAYVFAQKFAHIAARLLGVEKVRLYHDQALYKEPLGGYTPWHQDQYYWPLDTEKTVTLWMPLVDITDDLGMLTFASGSHLKGAVESAAISDESERIFEEYIHTQGFEVSKARTMKAGDATFHMGWTIHCAGPNRSETITREVMTIIYYADGTRIKSPENDNQKQDLAQWLGNLPAGSLAASELNPVLG